MKLRRQLLPILTCLVALMGTGLPAIAAQDHFKRSLKWPAKPQRILSLSPATTEMLYAVGAAKQVVGVTNDCNYPAAAASKSKTGRFGQINLEKILKLKPDLIVVTADMGQAIEPLRRLRIPVLGFKTPSVTAIQNNLTELGTLTGHAGEAQKAVGSFKARLQKVKSDSIASRTVMYMVWDQPLVTATPSSFIGNVLSLSGGRNVVTSGTAPFINYSLEAMLRANPDVLILPKSVAGRLKLDQPPYNRLKAVQNKHVMRIDDDLISRPGPRVVTAIEQIHAYLKGLRP